LLPPLKERGFVLNAYVWAQRQQGGVAEWSACPPVNLATRVRFPVPLHFSFFLSPRPRHLSTPPNTLARRLLGGRVVSVATLPMMVSRLGWGSRFKSDPRLNAEGSPVTPSGTLESGRMGNTSPATEPLRRPTQPHFDELRVER